MKLHKNTLFAFLAATLVVVSCQRHLVVPPPEPPIDQVEVDCMFQGLVDTSSVTIQDGVNDYMCQMLVTKNIQPSPFSSSAIYADSLGSANAAFLSGIRLDLGSFNWVDDGSNNPTISEFQYFFSGTNLQNQFGDSVNIPFSDGAVSGVQITWYDNNGTPYYSRDTSTYQGTYFFFQNVLYEADNDNEYVKWSAQFTARLWSAGGASIVIENGLFNGAFRRRTQ